MKIAFDAEPLAVHRKTGVGKSQSGITSALLKTCGTDHFILDYFALRSPAKKASLIAPYMDINSEQRVCRYLSGGLYRLLWGLVPVPYSLFFGSDAEITHFFNFLIPPGVKGKSVVTVHDLAFRRYPKTVRWRTRAVLKLRLGQSVHRADLVVTPSQFTKDELIHFYNIPEKKVAVVPNGIDLSALAPDPDKAALQSILREYGLVEGRYFLYVGTIEPRKNLERLLDAYLLAVETMIRELPIGTIPPVLVMAGQKGWYCDAVCEKAAALENRGYLKTIGYVPEEHLRGLYAGAVAFLFPSLYEGFGMPIIEAMACGAPVLTSNAASMPEVCGDDAILCDPFSTEDIAGGILHLYREPSLRKDLSQRGRERALRYSWENSANLLYKLYMETLNEKYKNHPGTSGG